MKKAAYIAGIAILLLSVTAIGTHAQAPAPAPAPPAAAPPPPPQLLFDVTMENTMREPLSQNSITTSNLDLELYGDGQDIIVAVGKGPNAPHTFNGLCDRPCGVAFRDRNNYFDLTGRANIKLTTMISGFHLVRPIIKLADGTVLIGDLGVGSPSDYQPAEISFRDLRWFKLDPKRGVTLGGNWVQPDLSKVEEVGYFDVIPGSGERVEGMPVEKMPPPPAGGWIVVSHFELWGKPVPRETKLSEK